RDEDRAVAGRRLRHAGGLDGGQPEVLEVEQNLVLLAGDAEGQLLQRVEDPARDEEPDEVTGRPDRDIAERQPLGRPFLERQLPGQLDEIDRGVTQAETGEGGHQGRWASGAGRVGRRGRWAWIRVSRDPTLRVASGGTPPRFRRSPAPR